MSLYQSAFVVQPGHGVSGGTTTVSAAQDTANAAIIETGLGTIVMMLVQVLRTNAVITGDAVITRPAVGGKITVANGGTYVLTTGDVIQWFAYGKRRQT